MIKNVSLSHCNLMNSKGPRICFNFCYWLEVDVKHDRHLHSKARKAEQNIKKTKNKEIAFKAY